MRYNRRSYRSARTRARLFEHRRDFWPGRNPLGWHEHIYPHNYGPSRHHSYNWYLKQLHLSRNDERY